MAYTELFNTSEVQYLCFHTGEVIPEKLNDIYRKKVTEPLTLKERLGFEKDWTVLSNTEDVVRIWENHKIKAVNEEYFDEWIVTTAQKLHAKQKEHDFVKSGRLIGRCMLI